MKILKKLEKSWGCWFIIFTSLLFFILRLPSLFEPIWYGDEGIYQTIGIVLNHGRLLYKDVFDNKPPLLYWLYSFFQSDQFTLRLVSLIFGILSVLIFFLLTKKLFKNTKIQFLTTFIFAILFGSPIIEGNIANAENFMLLPILLSALLIFSSKLQAPSFKFFAAGLLLGIAFLFKVVAIFDLSAFFVFCFFVNFNSSLKKELKLIPIILGFCLPIFSVSLFFILNDSFVDFIRAAFISNISYVNYGNTIGNTPYLLFIKLILLGGLILYLFTKRKKLNESFLFILIWFAFSLFNAFFSQRAYTHYLLVLLPSFSLMIGLALTEKKYQKIVTIFFLISLIAVIKVFGIPNFNKSINYYQNFLSYVRGVKTTVSYQAFFDQNTPVDYEIARFIRPNINNHDAVFIWGNNAQLYQLIGVIPPTKYVVSYHMLIYKDGITSTKNTIEKTKPKFVVIMPIQEVFPFPLINYSKKIIINKVIIYERLF